MTLVNDHQVGRLPSLFCYNVYLRISVKCDWMAVKQ